MSDPKPFRYVAMHYRRHALCAALFGLLLSASPGQGQTGHTIAGNQVRVQRASHWRAWQGASSLVQIAPDGAIRPLLTRKDVNAALDVAEHAITGTPGGVAAGTNPATARNAIDGDRSTTWRPSPAAALHDWWLELDLGRLVVVRKIIIRFADEPAGDPFLQFKVLGWRQPPPRSTTNYTLAGTRIPRFWEIGRTTRPNKTRRVFEFEPRPTEGADAAFAGDPLERIQLIATHSDTSRAFEVSAAEFEALSSGRRGAVDYYRRTLDGALRRVSEPEYEGFSAERQGPIRYFRRELPAIAEIEIITAGDNINLGLLERGGGSVIETSGGDHKDIGAVISDGDYSKGHNGSIFAKTYEYLHDLGGLFWVDTMHFLTDGASSINELAVDVSDGRRAPDGSISYTTVGQGGTGSASGHSSSGGIRFREIAMVPAKVRFIRARFGNPLNGLSYIGFTEVMVYGQGFVPAAELTGDLIQLGSSKNLISVDWDGDTPAGTRIQVETRTGGQPKEVVSWHDNAGNAITESRFLRLPPSKRGDITTRLEPGDDWSPWSVPYTTPGAQITSPSPRPYLQLRVRLETDRVDTAATLRSIVVQMAEPVAERLVGEIWPLRIDHVGGRNEFVLYIRPTFHDATQGFDELRLQATAGATTELISMHRGREQDFADGTEETLALAQSVASEPGVLQIRLAERVGRGTELIQIRFRATILGNSASFRGLVRDGSEGDWQRVDEGDATDLVNSQQVTVLALAGRDVLSSVVMSTPVLTPNGDGVNDEVALQFSVARISASHPVSLTIRDLAGGVVHEHRETRLDARGQYEWHWDGRDIGGQLVTPGVYVLRLEVEADSETAAQTTAQRVIHVAY